MDNIANAIVEALTVAASSGVADVGKRSISDAYEALKSLLRKAFSDKPAVLTALAKVEEAPDSPSRVGVLSKELSAHAAHSDPEILAAVKELRARMTQAGVNVAGHHNAVVVGTGDATVTDSRSDPD